METDFLKLYEKDPIVNANDTFNITTMLNENWNKIDSNAKAVNIALTGKALQTALDTTNTNVTNLTNSVATSLAEKVSKTLITASNDFIVGSGNGTVAKKTLAETKAILGVTIITNATETSTGVVELATTAEVTQGTDPIRAVTPKALKDQGYFNQGNYGAVIGSNIGTIALILAYANTVIQCTGGTITIPTNASVPFSFGTQITFVQNSGTSTFVPSSGVTLYSKDNKRTIDGIYAGVTLIKTYSDTWYLIGALK